jgi:hypothetical protein
MIFAKNTYIIADARQYVQVSHLYQYLEGHKGFIAGGCFKNLFQAQKPKDIDIFFRSSGDYAQAKDLFDRKSYRYVSLYTSEKANGYYDKYTDTKVDLVFAKFGSIEEILDSFDFTVAQMAYEGDVLHGAVTYHSAFHVDLFQKRLHINDRAYDDPCGLLKRVMKYVSYGFTLSDDKLIRILNAIRGMEQDVTLEDFGNVYYDDGLI